LSSEENAITIDELNKTIILKNNNNNNSSKELKFQFTGVFDSGNSNNNQVLIYNTIAKDVNIIVILIIFICYYSI